jgi:hypothetical protein
VHITGRERDYILQVRNRTAQAQSPDPLAPAAVLLKCETLFRALRGAADDGAVAHLPKGTDWAPLAEWLFSVRWRSLLSDLSAGEVI